MARNIHIWCGYVDIPDRPGWYYAGFRVSIPEALDDMYTGEKKDLDQTIQCGEDHFRDPRDATIFAQKNANTYLNLLAVFGIIDVEEIANTFYEWISTN